MGSDPSGALKFGGKAVLHSSGVDFSNGSSFAINMGELELHEELGKGNYGTVKKVRHKPTNVYMAMKVRFVPVAAVRKAVTPITGDSIGIRRLQVKRYNYGT